MNNRNPSNASRRQKSRSPVAGTVNEPSLITVGNDPGRSDGTKAKSRMTTKLRAQRAEKDDFNIGLD